MRKQGTTKRGRKLLKKGKPTRSSYERSASLHQNGALSRSIRKAISKSE